MILAARQLARSRPGPSPTRAEAAAAPAPPPAAAPPRLRLRAAGACVPHPDKAHYGGEDAHFVSAAANAIGVADGVGGWADDGVNPAAYAQELMAAAQRYLEGADGAPLPSGAPRPLPPRGLMRGERTARRAIAAAHATTRLPGSATALVLRLDAGRGVLDAAAVGDAGFVLVRGGRVAARSPALEHAWDCPFQLGHPEWLPETDTAADAAVLAVPLEAGDVVVAGSDGLLDNVREAELLAAAAAAAAAGGDPAALADALAALAARNAADPECDSPWAEEATAAAAAAAADAAASPAAWWGRLTGAPPPEEPRTFRGGKLDDVTVVAAVVELDAGEAGGAAVDEPRQGAE